MCPGLYLVVQTSGAKSWAVRYRYNGKPRKHTLGPYPKIKLAETDDERKARLAKDPKSDPPDARGLARLALAAVATGKDPQTDKVEARRREASGVAAADLFETVWAAYMAQHVTPNLRESTRTEWDRFFRNVLQPRWRKRRLSEVTPADIDALKVDLRKTPAAADKALAVLTAFFNWTMEEPRRLLAASPCKGIKKTARRKEEEDTEERALSDDEIRWLWHAADKSGFPFGPMVKLLVLTGARRNEVSELADSEIDRPKSLWTLPAERAKNGRKHEIHLSDASLAVLDSMPRVTNKAGFRFSTNGESPCSGFSRAKRRLDRDMLELARAEAKKLGRDPAKVAIAPWRLHDLRRTFATGMAKIGIALPVVEKCLNHVSGSFAGIVRTYHKHQYTEEKKAAFNAWGSYVTALVSHEPVANVVSIRRA